MAMFKLTSDEEKKIESLKKEREKLRSQRSYAGFRSLDDPHDRFLEDDIDEIDRKISWINTIANDRWRVPHC